MAMEPNRFQIRLFFVCFSGINRDRSHFAHNLFGRRQFSQQQSALFGIHAE